MTNKQFEIEAGDVVKSTAGHDKQKLYVVTQIIDKNFVNLADGKSRQIIKPKKKRKKHLERTIYKIDLKQKNDSDLICELKKIKTKLNGG